MSRVPSLLQGTGAYGWSLTCSWAEVLREQDHIGPTEPQAGRAEGPLTLCPLGFLVGGVTLALLATLGQKVCALPLAWGVHACLTLHVSSMPALAPPLSVTPHQAFAEIAPELSILVASGHVLLPRAVPVLATLTVILTVC